MHLLYGLYIFEEYVYSDHLVRLDLLFFFTKKFVVLTYKRVLNESRTLDGMINTKIRDFKQIFQYFRQDTINKI